MHLLVLHLAVGRKVWLVVIFAHEAVPALCFLLCWGRHGLWSRLAHGASINCQESVACGQDLHMGFN